MLTDRANRYLATEFPGREEEARQLNLQWDLIMWLVRRGDRAGRAAAIAALLGADAHVPLEVKDLDKSSFWLPMPLWALSN